jgi:2-polyprenyl-3-methyl-5-hydroxy-6-metoxy-1,4-benzoquinol methylase
MNRALQPEAMDDSSLEDDRHRRALRGLSRLNRLSGSARILWPPLAALARPETSCLRVLDLACGAGDVPLGLWRRARRAGIYVDIHGVDISPQAVRFAQERAEQEGAPLNFGVRDVLRNPLPEGFDAVLCSLFLHHLNEDQVVLLLTKMRQAARRIVLVNDLLRSDRGLWLAYLASRLFTSSAVVRVDATRSVRAAFTADEMRNLARRARMNGAEVSRRWPLRLLLSWMPA